MQIVVCVKHVPDVQSDRRFTEDGRVDRDQDAGTLNELDEYALEAALVLVEAHGGEVTVLTMGPARAEDAVRRGLQVGADHGVHVRDETLEGSDVFATARVLASAVRRVGERAPVDLVLTGTSSLDGQMAVLPALLGAELGWPTAPHAARIDVAGASLEVRRHLEDAEETLVAPLPAVVSITDRANEPRYPNFKGIQAARKKSVELWTLADLAIAPNEVGRSGARTRVATSTLRPPRDGRVLLTDTGDAGVRIADFLAAHQLI